MIELTAESLAFGGDGIARHEGCVIFVRGALPGEKVRARIVEKKAHFARADTIEILQASPHRIVSPCAYFPACGGCQYLHLDYAAQLDAKRQQVEDLLRRVGKVEFPPLCVIACPEPFHYRNRIKLHLLRKDNTLQAGFVQASGHGVIPIERCAISESAINAALPSVLKQLQKAPRAKTVSIRANAEGKVDFWTEQAPIDKEATLTENVGGKIFQTPSAAFFQVHPAMTELLAQEVAKAMPPTADVLIDAYCGVGLFSVLFGERFKEVVGIEQDQDSVRWARKNMRANGLEHGVFYEGRVELLLEKALEKLKGKKGVVILDPPRDGLETRIPQLLNEAKPARIIYVSCNPSTLARDLGRLSGDYQIRSVSLVDMFPQTMHCETVTELFHARPR